MNCFIYTYNLINGFSKISLVRPLKLRLIRFSVYMSSTPISYKTNKKKLQIINIGYPLAFNKK